MTDNMELWKKVCETDPDHTKHVGTRGGFTAIDAMYQIQCATEQFGAAGKGWGWSFSDPIFPPNGTVVVKCTLWHRDKGTTVEQFGQKKLGGDDRPDEDAFKKAGTDALTKCLSYLGFNADVFLGKFDDNKYTDDLKKKKAAEVAQGEGRKKAETWVNSHMLKIDDCKDERDLRNLESDDSKTLLSLGKKHTDLKITLKEYTAKKRDSFGLQSPSQAAALDDGRREAFRND